VLEALLGPTGIAPIPHPNAQNAGEAAVAGAHTARRRRRSQRSERTLRLQQRLDGAALVHRSIPLSDFSKGQREIEDLLRVKVALEHQLDQVR
jgi:hypothetical protein